MEESDAIIFPILKEVGCDLPPTITSIKQLLDEHVYQIAAGCLHAINSEAAVDLPTKFPTSKATKFRAATEVARVLKVMGYQGEIGYQSILYPHESEIRKIIGFLIGRLPRKEQQELGFDSGSTNIEVRVQQTLQQINPINNWTIFHKNIPTHAMIPFDSVTLEPLQTNTAASVQISDQIKTTLTQRPAYINDQTLQSTYWAYTYQPRVSMSTSTTEQMFHSRLIPSIIQNNTIASLTQKRAEDALLPEAQQFQHKIQNQLQSNLTASFKQALTEAKIAKSQYEQQKLQKLKQSSLLQQQQGDNVFTRKAQFTQENAVALASTEPIISLEEQLAQDKAEYELAVQRREDELGSLQSQLDSLYKQYKQLNTNIQSLQTNIDVMNNEDGSLDNNIETIESTYKTRCHVIDFLPNAQENITKLRQLTEVNMNKITKLNTEWDKLRLEMMNEYRTLQHQYKQRQDVYSNNLLQLQNIRAEIKSKGNDIRSKEEQYNIAVQEYESMPQSMNRNVYIKRIMDIVKNIDKQNEEIGTILLDIKSVQREITNKGESVKRSFSETDDLIYNTAKSQKSAVAIGIYKDVVTLRDGFNTIIDNVETIGKKQNIIRELEQSIELIQDRGTMNSFDSVLADLHSVQDENKALQAAINKATASSSSTATATESTKSTGKKKKAKQAPE